MESSLSLIKILLPAFIAFAIGIFITPFFTNIFYKYKLWKKKARATGVQNKFDENGKIDPEAMSEEFQKISDADRETKVPRVGGIIIWVSVLLSTLLLFLLFVIFPNTTTAKLEFISLNQTVLPLIALFVGAVVGLINDLLDIRKGKGIFADGFPKRYFILIVTILGAMGAWWFYTKLGMDSLYVPILNIDWSLGPWFVIVFIFVTLATFSSGVIDGIDGLSGGTMAIIFAAMSVIAFSQNQIDLAAFSAVVSGAILSFLWFNIPPARFWMGETGMLALTLSLVTVSFLTDTVLLLPIIAFPLVITAGSSVIQIVAKKMFGHEVKVFLVAPLHHHLESLGWSREKIVMRYWVIGTMSAITGVLIALI
jgi:phospho-N-acetylmuramoyl-pentapeptide-transferase